MNRRYQLFSSVFVTLREADLQAVSHSRLAIRDRQRLDRRPGSIAPVCPGSRTNPLLRRRHADVYRFALHMSGTAALADDVTQDVFLIVMRDAPRYEAGRSSVIAWLRGIARNCVRQRLDRDSRLESLAVTAEDDGALPVVQPDPLGEMSRVERIAMLHLNPWAASSVMNAYWGFLVDGKEAEAAALLAEAEKKGMPVPR